MLQFVPVNISATRKSLKYMLLLQLFERIGGKVMLTTAEDFGLIENHKRHILTSSFLLNESNQLKQFVVEELKFIEDRSKKVSGLTLLLTQNMYLEDFQV